MKYLKTYENNVRSELIFDKPWTMIKLKRINKLKNDISVFEQKLLPLLKRYLKIIIPKINIHTVTSYRYYEHDNVINVQYYTNNFDIYNIKLVGDEFKEFFDFLKNPDLYENSKKYNL